MKKSILIIILAFSNYCFAQNYNIVDTGVSDSYSSNSIISKPTTGEAFYGQDANYNGNQPSYTDNGDGTITDNVSGLMWQKDMGAKISYPDAIDKAETLTLAGYSDWRLPNAKELQSIVDYSRSPQSTNSPAIDPVFSTSEINDPNGNPGQFPYFWTGTSHLDGANPYSSAVYIAFGEAQGVMNGNLMDVHGAGAQRSDPKSGSASDYPQCFGPQGDVRYVFNAVRCVRDVNTSSAFNDPPKDKSLKSNIFPNPVMDISTIQFDYQLSNVNIEIFSLSGQSVFKNQWQEKDNVSLELSNLVKGLYLMRIAAEGEVLTAKLVKQ